MDVWGVLYCGFVASAPRMHLGCLILLLSNPQGCNVVSHAAPLPSVAAGGRNACVGKDGGRWYCGRVAGPPEMHLGCLIFRSKQDFVL